MSTYQLYAEELHDILYNEKDSDERERKVKDIISDNNLQNRMNIRTYYEKLYQGHKLLDDLDSQLSSNFCDLVKELFMEPLELDCFEIHEALHALTYDKENLFEFLTARPYRYKQKLLSKYQEMYQVDLLEDIKSQFGADQADNIIALIQTQRDKVKNPEIEKIIGKTNELLGPEIKDWTENKSTFYNVFVKSSPEELVQIGRLYFDKTGKDFLDCNKNPLINEIMYNSIAPSEGFARKIHQALKRFKVNRDTLNRIVASRAEVDLGDIKKKYNNLYHITLGDDIANETSGTYKDLLVDLVTRAEPTKQE